MGVPPDGSSTQTLTHSHGGYGRGLGSTLFSRPAGEGVSVWTDDELYLAVVPRTDVVCRYFVIVHERLILLDRFDQP